MKISELSGFDINKPVHAYLIAASGVSASREYAALLAKALLCETNEADGQPCGKCSSCIKCDASTHPDVSVLGKDTVSVNDIRALRDKAYLAANEGSGKIFILHGFDRFNAQSQNALLKILEEPPAGVTFILSASSKSSVLPTILSRCCVLMPGNHGYEYYEKAAHDAMGNKASLKDVQIIASYLYNYDSEDIETLDTDTVLSAYKCAEDYFTGRDSDIISRFPKKKTVKEPETTEITTKAKEAAAKKEQNSKSRNSLGVFLRTLMLYTKNIALYKQSGGRYTVRPANEDFRKICVRLSAKRAVYLYEVLEKAYLLSESNANPNALYAFISKSI